MGGQNGEIFKDYAKGIESGERDKGSILIFDCDFSDKKKRTEVHQFIRENLPKFESDTLCEGDKIRKLRVFFSDGVSNNERKKKKLRFKKRKHNKR